VHAHVSLDSSSPAAPAATTIDVHAVVAAAVAGCCTLASHTRRGISEVADLGCC